MSNWWTQIQSYWAAGGPLLWPIGLVCLGIWGYFLRSRYLLSETLREGARIEMDLDRGAYGQMPEQLLAGLASSSGGLAFVVRSALEDIQRGAAPREAFEIRTEEGMALLGRDILVLAALTSVAPLLGLLGTVMGMIQTFDAASTIGGETGVRVASGISRALITTQFGLVVAMPGVFGIARLQRMRHNVQSLLNECRSHVLQALEFKTGKSPS